MRLEESLRNLKHQLQKKVPFKLATDDVLSLTAEVKVKLYVDNRLEASNCKVISVARVMPTDDYQVGVWASYGYIACARPWADTMLQKQSEFGCDFAHMAHHDAEIYMQTYAEHNMWPVAESMVPEGELHYNKHNLADAKYWEELDHTLDTKLKNCYKWGSFDFSTGDEHSLGSFPGRDELTVRKFTEYIKTVYGDINALNTQWGTSFKSWGEFTPEVDFDPEVSIAPRLEYEMFCDQLFIDFLKVCKKKIRAIDSRNRVGMTGTRDSGHYIGYDWWKIMKEVTHLAFYDGLQRECVRSFKKPGDFITSYIGFDFFSLDERNARYFPWLELFSGFNGVSYYSASSGDLHGYVSHDLTDPLRAKWAKEELNEIKNGIGHAILTAKRQSAPIAVHLSQRSLYAERHARTWANVPWPPTGAGTYLANIIGITEVIKDMGLQFDLVADEQVENGILQDRNYKAMILPLALALSDAEVKNITHFVQRGGRVIVTGAAGVYNEHGKIRKQGALDELLGIKTQTPPMMAYLQYSLDNSPTIPADSHSRTPIDISPLKLLSLDLPVAPCDSTVSAAKTALTDTFSDSNKTIAMAQTNTDKGNAIFLNFLWSGYRTFSATGVAGETTERDSAGKGIDKIYRDVFSKLIEGTGIKTPTQICGMDGKKKNNIEQIVYRRGPLTYLCILPRYYGGRYTPEIRRQHIQAYDYEPINIQLKQNSYVYNIRDGKPLGKTGTIQTSTTEAVAHLYALTPYEIKGLKLTCPEVISRGQELTVKVSVNSKDEIQLGDHVIHLNLVAPTGIRSECYKINLLTQSGNGVWTPKMAFNETIGTWYVEAKDVISGKTARVPFKVIEKTLSQQ